MNKTIFIICAIACSVIIASSVVWATNPSDETDKPDIAKDKATVVKGNNKFAFDLYAKLRAQNGNLFCSPNSISTALAMTYAGARGETEKQMAKVLHFGLKQERLHPAFAALIKESAPGKPEYYQLSIANALWGQKGYQFLPEFLDLTNKNYSAGIKELDFIRDTEKARQAINAWVEKETQDKIKELIQKNILNDLTTLVLTNAIYFKGTWLYQFDKNKTQEADFTLADGKKIKAQMMSLPEPTEKSGRPEFAYRTEKDFQLLKLPYNGKELAMIILLPDKYDGLADCENMLTADNINNWCEEMHDEKVIVSLPRFKVTCNYELNKIMANMGMPLAFTRTADFSGMESKKELLISNIIHKAFVDVNEEGTEAAAATAVVMTRKNGKSHPVFYADHPFIFIIRDERSGAILFMGRLMTP